MPEPLTPPDCDLRGLQFMQLDVMRLLDSDLFALSNGEEFKAAIALWCKCWLQVPAASLPKDDRILAHLSGSGNRWKKLKDMALRGFVECSDGRLYHPVVAEKANDAWERRGEWQEKQTNKTERQQRWRARVKELSEELRSLGVTPPSNATLSTLEGLLASTKASTGDAAETRQRRLREGEGEGDIQLGKPNCASGEKSPGQPTDADKAFWDNAKAYLGKAKAPLIGKWCSQYGQPDTAQAITSAQLSRAVDPVPYIERTLRNGKTRDEELPIC